MGGCARPRPGPGRTAGACASQGPRGSWPCCTLSRSVFKILDRYLVREIIIPLCLGLLVMTFVLMMPPILKDAEKLIAKGVAWQPIIRAMLTLVPQALCITIPMAVLLGILVGFGRLSADREFVALQPYGASMLRLLRQIVLLAML